MAAQETSKKAYRVAIGCCYCKTPPILKGIIYMNPIFSISGISYYPLEENQKKTIIDIFNAYSGIYEVPKTVWQGALINLPSPIRSADCCSVYTSGVIDVSATTPDVNIMDIIRKESKPKKGELEYNVYRHHIVTSGIYYFISEPVEPNHHWSTSGTLNRVYGF